eukprot:126553-Amphidinium_carterae.1
MESAGHANLVHEWVLAIKGNTLAVATAGGGVDKRMLPYMSWTDFYELYTTHMDEGSTVAGKTCFMKTYRQDW